MKAELAERTDKYLALTEKALAKVRITEKDRKAAEDLLELSKCYYNDAKHFRDNGDLLRSYGAVCYAHCFLDSGARLGLFDVDGDNELFMVDPK